jgi:hypothetical protein
MDLDRFMELGMPFPKFFPRQMDIDMFLNDIKSRIPFWNDTELDFQNLIDDAGFDSEKISLRFQDFVFQKLKSNAVFNQTILEFPEFEAELKKQLPEYAAYFVATPMSKYDKESFELKKDGIVFRLRSYYRRPFSKGDEVYSIVSESIGRIEKVRQGMALLNDGQIVPIKRGSLFFLENLSCNGTEIPLHYPEASVVSIIAGKSYLLLNQCKNQVFGNKPSPLLWRASVIYRSCLSFFGIRAIPVGTSINN